jgi:ribosomal protein L2
MTKLDINELLQTFEFAVIDIKAAIKTIEYDPARQAEKHQLVLSIRELKGSIAYLQMAKRIIEYNGSEPITLYVHGE